MLVTLAAATDDADAGAKAERLAAALAAGLPVLPGWVVPARCARPALLAGATAIAERGVPAGRRTVLAAPLPDDLAAELPAAVRQLGGRVIARSSSPLESDARWSGAFSSVAEVGPGDIATAVRSVWASAFALDPLSRLEASGLAPQAVQMAVLIQPEIRPDCGGTARVFGGTVTVEGVRGHPGALMSGWADGAAATVRGEVAGGGLAADGGLAALIGVEPVLAAARLALAVHQGIGDNTIEWAAADGDVYLLQSSRTPGADQEQASPATSQQDSMRGLPGAPGAGSGRLLYRRPHEPLPRDAGDIVLLVDRPVPALAPLLFAGRGGGPGDGRAQGGRPDGGRAAAGRPDGGRPDGGRAGAGPDAGVIVRAVISRGGPPGSHLAEVARALAVPLVTGCPLSAPDGSLVTVDGGEGTVAVHAPQLCWLQRRSPGDEDIMVDISGRIAVACAAAAVLLAGCGTATDQSVAGDSHAAHAAASPAATSPAPATGAATPGACTLITLTGLRSHGAIMNATNTPTALHKYQVTSDPRSFTARVSVADVTSAGINTSGMNQSSSVVVVVNHGRFDRSQYGEDVGPAASSSAPPPEKYADWLIYLIDPNTGTFSFVLTDNNCIRE